MTTFKLPDFEGGFITKCVEGNFIVTRANDGSIIEEKPVNKLAKGLKTEFGRVLDFDGNDAILFDGKKEFRASKVLLNTFLAKSLGAEHEQGHEHEEIVSGTFETPVGRVEASGSGYLRELLTSPDKIIAAGYSSKFYKSLNGKELSAEVGEKKLFGSLFVKCFTVRTRSEEPQRKPVLKSLNIFSTPKSTSGNNPLKGREKAGHKYIERKPNPNGEGYIYLYQLPNGRKVWRDEKQNQVNSNKAIGNSKQTGNEKRETEEGRNQKSEVSKEQEKDYAEKAKQYFKDFMEKDLIKRGESVGQILKVSDNFLAVDFGGQTEVINKKDHLQLTDAHSDYKSGDKIEYDGKPVVLLQVSNNLALGRNEDGSFVLIKKEKPIRKYEAEAQGTRHKAVGDRKGIDKYSYVYQGYGELDNDFSGIDYEDDAEFKDFNNKADETGLDKIDDLTRRKYVDKGNEKHSVAWNYNPEKQATEYFVDGIQDYPLEFNGGKYVVRDINDEGYLLDEADGKETGIFLPHKDYDNYLADVKAKEDAETTISRLSNGDLVIGSPKNSLKIKPQYSDEELARFGKKRGRLTLKTNSETSKEKKGLDDIQKENDSLRERNKEIMQGEAFGKFSKQIEGRGFKQSENPFIANKKIEIDGRKFEVRAEFNPATQQYKTTVEGPVQSITVGGITYPITDVHDNKVSYQKGNSEKEISINELKEINGKGIFKPLSEGKAIFGRTRQIKLANGEVHEGRYALVDLDDITASHNETNFRNSEGYPIDETGQNINDRDYENDKNLQETVRKYARELDPLQLINNHPTAEGTPIVNNEMLVVSGNNRTMSSKLAANENPEKWAEYQKELQSELPSYGIDPEEIKNYKKPFLVRVDDSLQKLSKSELHKYNQDMKKGESEVAATIKFRDILKNHTGAVDKLIDVAKDFETQSELFGNKDAQDKLKKILLDTKIVTENKISDYFTSDGLLTKTGQNISKQLFAASIFEPDVLRVSDAPGVKEVSNAVSDNIAPILVNRGVGNGYSLNNEINDAVNLQYKFVKSALKEQGGTFENFATQRDMFADVKPNYKSVALNYLAKKGSKSFSNVLKKYNEAAKLNEDAGMFGGFTPDEVFDQMVLNSVKTNNKGEESPMFSNTEKQIISGLQKSLVNRLIRLIWKPLRKSLDKAKLVLRRNNKVLNEGTKLESEHENLYDELSKRLEAEGSKMPMEKTEFFRWIAKLHIDEKPNYYELLQKYVGEAEQE